jgi:hypothetical protein
MISKAPIDPSRLRTIRGSFSWIDHRLLTQGFLAAMSADEMLLYFFLVLVGDRHGISFYSYDKIASLLKLEVERLLKARDGLFQQSLIAFEDGRYQVLQLPARPHPQAERRRQQQEGQQRHQEFVAFAEILQQLAKPKS